MSLTCVGICRLTVVLLAAASAATCSGGSPAQPTPSAEDSGAGGALAAQAAPGAPGVYDLSFNVISGGTVQQVSTLAVSSAELILMAHVTNGAGAPALQGSAAFEYCSYRKLPPNDITRADEAPKEACEQGTATWKRLASVAVDAGSCPGLGTGYACYMFGIVRIPRTVGFRLRFSGQRSGIASGSSDSLNFTWS